MSLASNKSLNSSTNRRNELTSPSLNQSLANTSLLDETKVETLDTQSLHIEMLRRLIIDGQLSKNGLKAMKDGIV